MNTVIDLKPRVNLVNEQRVARYQELERKIAKYKEELELVKAELITALDNDNKLRNRNGELIAWLKVTEAQLFDSKRFKEDFKDVYDEYKKTTIRRIFKTA